MSTEQDITHNIQAINPNLEKLKQAFPHCFDKNGAFDFAKFKAELDSNDINIAKEGYSLDWLGKSYARVLASDAATTLLKEDEVHNTKPENANSQNLLIKGDNLEVLKHLSNAYYEKVKMIYIDPPYNTGSDGFVYNDDRKFTAKQLQDLAGVSEDEAKRILEFTQSNSNSHSAWLTFMYPRLYIAKQLLKDDGVIFVSIDDNEVAQLRLLMDEVFGEENFIGELIIQTATDNNKTQINIEHEYMLCFAKQKSLQPYWIAKNKAAELIQEKYLELKTKYADDLDSIQTDLRKWIKQNKSNLPKVTHYDNVDENGVFHDGDIANTKFGGYEYDILHPVTKKVCKVPEKGFRYPKNTLLEMIEEGEIMFGADESTLMKPKKRLLNAKDVLRSIIYEDGRSSSNYVESLLCRGAFNNPKSHTIIKRILDFITIKGDIVLDFFAGSGTTGDAVMQLNKEDGGNRQFILVQLSELIDAKKSKAAYDFVKDELGVTSPTIFEITKERIIRAAKQLGDTSGFKIFETTPIWEDYDFKAEKLANAKKLFDDDKLTEADVKALFTTWKTYDGSPLTEPVQEVGLAGYKAYYTKQKLYLMHKGFSTVTLKALLEQIDADANFNPTAIIAFGYYFESKALREIAENIKTYNNKKNIDIDFITRY